jgi:primosomal protein N' (replication factor Y)
VSSPTSPPGGGREPAVIRVEPLVTARGVRGPFDYARPAGCDVGAVVEVPFGRQRLRGVVTALAETSEHALKEPLSIDETSLPPSLVELALWMAGDVVSTPARCLDLLLPPADVTERTRLWAAVVPGAIDAGTRLTERQRALLDRLPGWTGDDLPALRRLEARGIVTIEPRAQDRRPDDPAVGAPARPVALNPDQTAAVERLRSAILGAAARRAGAGDAPASVEERLLLHGVTGSGKTEVYLQAAACALEAGRGVVVLVPEIALTPQTVARFRARLGDAVAVLHSGLSRGERRDEWWRLRRGEARVCVGPMSAVLAPLEDVGLVIVDEEHDPAFKHDGDPRYDARRVAAWRARRDGGVLVAGSATPRPESWLALPRISLPRRADGRPLPPVELVDVRRCRTVLERTVHQALIDARKAIVLLNRRGWATSLQCADCGHAWQCPNCDVSLVLHGAGGPSAAAAAAPTMAAIGSAGSGVLRCHHCGHREPPPVHCPACRSVSVGRHGLGTEQLAADLPGHVFRLDADVRDRAGVLERFGAAEEGILVGTQMIAKGHDFPDVDLGVVVDADATLRFPDFRSQERTFQLVAQLAGRAGRGGATSGRVLVQTRSPKDASLRLAAAHDAETFLAGELDRRRERGFPPFATLARITCEHEDEARAQAAGEVLRQRLPREATGPLPLFRRQGRFRRTLELRGPHRGPVVAAVRAAVDSIAGSRGARGLVVVVEIDPR